MLGPDPPGAKPSGRWIVTETGGAATPRMDIRNDDDLDRLEARADFAIHTEDDGRALIIPPQAVKDLIAELRRLRTQLAAPGSSPLPVNVQAPRNEGGSDLTDEQ